MKLNIDPHNIERSFDLIACELINKKLLAVNEMEFRFTEIEFYYYHEEYHQDKYTHDHKLEAGKWRFHNQGLDITFQGTNISDGGILIRGINSKDKFVNGPRKILQEIFKAFGEITQPTTIQLKDASPLNIEVYKTFRHLPNKESFPEFHNKHYRYLVDPANLEISNAIKQSIIKNMELVQC